MGSKWTKKDEKFIIDNYKLLTTTILSQKLNRTKIAVKNKIQKLGIKLDKKSKKERYKQRKQKHSINANFFIYPKNELIAGYLLGFIWADGYVNKKTNAISVYITTKDMEDIKKLFLKSGDWRTYNVIPKIGKPLTRIGCHCWKLHEFLTENDYQNKSFLSPDKIVKDKSDIFLRGFWRGYLDGDGCYYLNAKNRKKIINLCGNKQQNWSAYTRMLKSLNCKFTKKINKTSSYVSICDADSILNLVNYIYNNKYDGIGLKRKFAKAQQIKQYIKERMNKMPWYYSSYS